MKLCELLLYYLQKRQQIPPKDKKKNEHMFILNVHKAYQYYERVDDNKDVDIETVLSNLDTLFEKYSERLKPCSMRNYIRWMKSSLTAEPLRGTLSDEVLQRALDKINEALKVADKEVNDTLHNETEKQEEAHDEQDSVIDIESIVPIGHQDDDTESDMDIESIVPIGQSDKDTIKRLIEENKSLKHQIAKLQFEKEKDTIRLEVCERLWKIVESKH